jgi:hypothetical protein
MSITSIIRTHTLAIASAIWLIEKDANAQGLNYFTSDSYKNRVIAIEKHAARIKQLKGFVVFFNQHMN